jgi:hypothetical protein
VPKNLDEPSAEGIEGIWGVVPGLGLASKNSLSRVEEALHLPRTISLERRALALPIAVT